MFKGVVCYSTAATIPALRVKWQLYASSLVLFTDKAGLCSFIRHLVSIEYRRRNSKVTDVQRLGSIRKEKTPKERALRVIPKGQAFMTEPIVFFNLLYTIIPY